MLDKANDLYLVLSSRRLIWAALSKTFTFFIPNDTLSVCGMNTKEKQQAWREKVTLFFLYLLLSGIFYFWLEYITTLFCEQPKLYSFNQVFSNSSGFSVINGAVVDWKKYENQTDMSTFVNANRHSDLSAAFPRFMLLHREEGVSQYSDSSLDLCIKQFNTSAQADNWLQYKVTHDAGYVYENGVLTSCPLPGYRNQTGSPCFYTEADKVQGNKYGITGELVFDPKVISQNFSSLPFDGISGQALVILDGSVLDVTDYITSVTKLVLVAKNVYSRAFVVERMFLPLDLTILLFTNIGSNITEEFYRDISYPNELKQCLLSLFFHGVIPSQKFQDCANMNIALWITLGIFFLYILLKLNLAYISCIPFSHHLFSSNSNYKAISHWPYTILFIPFYSEPSETIRQTFDSLARTTYPDNRKLLMFVCDGLTKSASDAKENYKSILDSLGYSSTNDPETRPYVSLGLGSRKINYAKVYAGFYESGGNRVPFIMIVKVGSLQETLSHHKSPGNRGKRDSMVIVLGFLERCMNLSYNRITPLEFELYNQCYNLLGVDPRRLKYMLVTDADTQVQADAVFKLVLRLEQNIKMLAVSGHVRPANPEENGVTMLQIIPNHLSYYSGMAYEACLNSVTSINGSFVMYRIWKEKSMILDHYKNVTKMSFHKYHHSSQQQQKWLKVSDENLPETTQSVTQQHVEPVCVSPTALRNFAAPRPSTMHMENILLQGEDHYFGVVLLKAHPQYVLGFESEAIAYTTLPTNLLILQGQQIRKIRACFHVQLEFQHTARSLGIRYWFISITNLINYILSMPLIAYSYSIYIRFFLYGNQVFALIAKCFAGLIFFHVFYFIIRRQFKHILWFGIYCVFSVPLFMIWFPLLAIWKSDSAYRWFDVWPIANSKCCNRLHGIVEDKFDIVMSLHEEGEKPLERLHLEEFEILEAKKQQLRELKEAAILDAKFSRFDNYVSQSAYTRVSSWATSSIDDKEYIISLPPTHINASKGMGIVRSTCSGHSALSINSVRTSHSTYSTHTDCSKTNKPPPSPSSPHDDARFLLHPTINAAVSHTVSIKSGTSSPNLFSTFLEDPVDRSITRASRIHRPSKSQSSYFSRSSYNSEEQANDRSTVRTSMLSLSTEFPTISSTARLSQAFSLSSPSPVSPQHTYFENDNNPSSSCASSIYSLSNSIISLEQDTDSIPAPPPPLRGDIPIHIISEDGTKIQRIVSSSTPEANLGRNAPIHSKLS